MKQHVFKVIRIIIVIIIRIYRKITFVITTSK